MTTATSTLNALIKADPTNFLRAMDMSIGKLLNFSDQVSAVSDAVSHFANGFVAEVAAVTTALGVASYSAQGFEDKVTDVYTLVDESVVSYTELSDSILKVANNLKDTPSATAEAHYQVLSAGVSDLNEALKVTETSGKLAKGGIGSTKEAVDLLTTALNAYGIDAKQVDLVSDQFMTTVKEGKTNIAELAASFGKVAPSAVKAKIGIAELNAATATLTKSGLSTAEAHTYIRAIINSVIKPTSAASKAAEKLGLDFSLTALKTKGLAGFLKDIQDKTKGSTEKTAELFSSVEALNGVLGLSGDKLKEYNKVLENIEKSLGATEKAFKKQLQPTKTLFTNIKNLTTEIGTRFLPVINACLAPLNKLFEFWHNLNPVLKETIIYLGIIASILAPFRYILLAVGLAGGRIVGIIPAIMNGIKWLIPWLIRAVPWLARFLGLTNPIGWAIMAIVGIVQLLRHNVFGLWDAVKTIYDAIVDYVSSILNELFPLSDFIEFYKAYLADLWLFLKLFFKFFYEAITKEIKEQVEQLVSLVKKVKDSVILYIRQVKTNFLAFFHVFISIINGIRAYLGLGKLSFQDFVKSVKKLINDLIESFKRAYKVARQLLEIFDNLWYINLTLKGLDAVEKTIDKFKEFKNQRDKILEQQEKEIDNQNGLNDAIDGTGKRLKGNSALWKNWAKELAEGLRNKSEALSKLTQKQPNYGGVLSGSTSSARSSGLFATKGNTYTFVIDGEAIEVQGKAGATSFEVNQYFELAKKIRNQRKRKILK